jgi:prefoldin subunit 5
MVPLIPIAKQAGILNSSISDIDTSIKKLQELKKSLEDITQEYNDKKSNQDSKYKQAILNEKSQYIDSINYAKQHAQNQLKEFQDKLSNLTVFSTREINSIGRKIANYYINLDD